MPLKYAVPEDLIYLNLIYAVAHPKGADFSFKKIFINVWGDQLCWFAHDCLSLSTENPISQETPQSWEKKAIPLAQHIFQKNNFFEHYPGLCSSFCLNNDC